MAENDPGSGAWRVARVGTWLDVSLVAGPRAPNQAMGPGMLGLMNKGPALHMLVGNDAGKKTFLDLAALTVEESREDFAHSFDLLGVQHPILMDEAAG